MRSALFLALVLALLLGPRAQTPHEGLSLLAQKRYGEALPRLDEELSREPGSAALGLARAQCLLELARWPEGLAAGQALLSQHPDEPGCRLFAGDALFLSFRVAEAIETWRPLLKAPGSAPEALPRMLNGLVATRRFAEAEEVLAGARSAGLPLSDATLRLAFRGSRRCEGRRAAVQELLARHPEDGDLAEELKVQEGICRLGGESTAPGPEGPSGTRIRARGGRPSVRVLLDGREKAWLVLDTGSQAFLLNSRLVRKLGLPGLGTGSFVGMGEEGATPSRRYLLQSLEVAGLRTRNASLMESPRGPDGIMGLGLLLDGVIDLDRRGGRLTLWPAGTSPDVPPAGEGTVLPALWVRGMPLVPVKVGHMGPFPFLLDTGAAFTLLSAKYAPLLGVRLSSANYPSGAGRGASGLFSVDFAEGVSLGLGGRTESFAWVSVSDVPRRFPLPVFGILGRDVLANYRLVFDGPGCRVSFHAYPGGRYRDPRPPGPPSGPPRDTRSSIPSYQSPP